MFKGKPTKVVITKEANEELTVLKKVVKEEISKDITSSDHQTLLNSIIQKIELLNRDYGYGIHIPKDRIPKEYVKKYDVTNLWKVNLSSAWRMIYTVRGTEVEIISLILDIINHKDYNKTFGYKKK